MRIVGLTGGVACGKSTVSRLVRAEHGVPIVDADTLSHLVLRRGTLAYRRVLRAFGSAILDERQAEIDRKKLGAFVFNDAAARRRLVAIQNPHIALALLSALVGHFLVGRRCVVLDAALLFETGLHRICGTVVAVHVDAATQLARLQARDGAGEDDARARIAAQPISTDDKARRADVALPNNDGVEVLAERLRQVAPSLLRPTLAQRVASGPSLLLVATCLSLLRWAWRQRERGAPEWLPPLLLAGAGLFAAVFVAMLLAFPNDKAVAVGAVKALAALAALCHLTHWSWVLLAVVVAAGRAVHALSRPTVLSADGSLGAPSYPGAAEGVLFAGSFNPPHAGHLALLRAIAAAHPPPCKLYVCIGFNPRKAYAVSVEARREMVAAACAGDPVLASRAVEAVVEPMYPWRFAVRHHAGCLYRGVRTWAKDGAAETLLAILNLLGPLLLEAQLPPATRYVEASPALAHVSSTLVRTRCARGESIDGLVPPAIAEAVAATYGGSAKKYKEALLSG